jgi:hypothetical protein
MLYKAQSQMVAWLMNDKLETIWKESFRGRFQLSILYSVGKTGENYEKYQAVYYLIPPAF